MAAMVVVTCASTQLCVGMAKRTRIVVEHGEEIIHALGAVGDGVDADDRVAARRTAARR